MKINFTKKEYRLLLEMLYLSNWMMNAHHVGSVNPEHEGLIKKIKSYFKEMGAEDILEQAESGDDWYEADEFDENLRDKFIEPYDTQTFWDELIHRLAERDAINAVGEEALKNMDILDRIRTIDEYVERYSNEFELHDLKHVKINYVDLIKS